MPPGIFSGCERAPVSPVPHGETGSSMVAAVPKGAVLAGCAAPDRPIATTQEHLGNSPAGHPAQLIPTQPVKSNSITLLCVTTASNDTLISRT